MTQDLIEKAIKGDLESFEIIVSHYKNSVYNLVLRILNDREEAQDVTQEAFIKLYSALPAFRGEAKFANWLYRITTNVCIDRYRLNKKHRANMLPEYNEHIGLRKSGDEKNNPEEIYQIKEQHLILQKAIADLPLKYRTAIVLRHMEGLSYREIADIMNIPVQTVGTQIHRAKAVLRQKLKIIREGGMSGG